MQYCGQLSIKAGYKSHVSVYERTHSPSYGHTEAHAGKTWLSNVIALLRTQGPAFSSKYPPYIKIKVPATTGLIWACIL